MIESRVMEYLNEKAMVAEAMARCYAKGLTTTTGGNISLRVGDVMLITPSGKDKSSLKSEDRRKPHSRKEALHRDRDA